MVGRWDPANGGPKGDSARAKASVYLVFQSPMIMPHTSINKRRVLIVDDDQGVTQMLMMLLAIKGYDVKIAASGSQAIAMAASMDCDLILLDLLLPDLEGFEVCRRLKEGKSTHHIPIIILSAKYLFEDKVEGLYLGADDYLTKPFEHEELFARMEAVMRRRSFLSFGRDEEDGSALIFELRKIIDGELVVPFFQPIYLLKPFRLLGVEVLSRPDTQTMLINPELLFKAALQFGCYCDLEIVVWKKALAMLADSLREARLPIVEQTSGQGKIFLNCNPYLLEGPVFSKIQSMFDEHHIPRKNVVLEITERSAISDFKAFYESMRRYRELGFQIAVDDVGGGYASLESIVEIRPQVVKIDGHIVSNLKKDAFKRSIIKFLVSFCKERHVLSVAEGIETKEDLNAVIDLGVDAGQGYYLHRPTPLINFSDLQHLTLRCKNP